MSLKEQLRTNWAHAPRGLRYWTLALIAFSVLSLIAMPKLTGVVRLGLTLLLFYHLLDKGQTARGLFIGGCLFGALLALSVLKAQPLLAIVLLTYSLGFAGYLLFSPRYKAWLKAATVEAMQTPMAVKRGSPSRH